VFGWSCVVSRQKVAQLYSMLALLIAPFALCYQFLGKTAEQQWGENQVLDQLINSWKFKIYWKKSGVT
jgi:hypothetical protein